ncbi:hypothetical protein [Streptomyces sp. NPDC002540]
MRLRRLADQRVDDVLVEAVEVPEDQVPQLGGVEVSGTAGQQETSGPVVPSLRRISWTSTGSRCRCSGRVVREHHGSGAAVT